MTGSYVRYPPLGGGGGGGAVDSVNGLTGVVVLTTTQITEGTRLYYTNARVNTQLTTPGPIGSVTPNTGAFTNITMTGRMIAGESADYTTGGYLFSETGNDTGMTSPGDGELWFYSNSNPVVKISGAGITEIFTVPYTWPNNQGTAGTTLTNDGAGGLSWSSPPALALPVNLNESFDPNNLSSTRFNIVSSVNPVAPSASSDITELQVYTDNFSAFPINGVWSIRANNQNLGSANVGYNGLIQGSQTIGNGTDPITLSQVYGVSANTFVQAGSTASSVSLYEHAFGSAAGSLVGPFSFSRSTGSVDHFTSSVEHYLAGMQIATVDGDARAFMAQDNITTANNNVIAYSDNTQVGNMPTANSGYVSFNSGPNISGSVGGFTSLSTHPQVGSVVTDFSAWEDGSNITTVGRNVNYVNQHPNIGTVVDNYTGWGASPHVTTHHGSFTDLSLNSVVDSLANGYQGVNVNPRMTAATPAAYDVTVTPAADVAGSMAGAYFGVGIPYSVGGDNFTPWLKVSGVGTAPGGQSNPIEVDVATNDSAATIATAIVAALSAYGAPLSTNLTFTDLGGSFQIVANTTGAANKIYNQANPTLFTYVYATYGSGGGTATGININMSQMVGYDPTQGKLQAINFNQGTFSGNMTFPFTNVPNPQPINSINVGLTVPASTSVTNADTFAFATLQQFTLEHDAHVTSGGLGVGSVGTGAIGLMQLDDSSSIADVAGCFFAFLPIGGTGAGGVVGMVHGYTFAGLPGAFTGSPTTITNAKAFEARAPGGTFTTSTAWGLYVEPGYGQNYMAGALKIGTTGGDTTTHALEVQDGTSYFERSVGIGTSTPAGKLDVNLNQPGGSDYGINLVTNSDGSGLNITYNGGGGNAIFVSSTGSNPGGIIRSARNSGSTSPNYTLFNPTGSRLGFITDDAQAVDYDLTFPQVQGGIGQYLANDGTGILSWLSVLLDSGGSTSLDFDTRTLFDASGNASFTWDNGQLNDHVGTISVDTHLRRLYDVNGSFTLSYSASNKVEAKGDLVVDGRLGVGTVTPAYKADVVGAARFNGNLGFYNTTPIAQPTSSGAATAGAVYTATEQTMLQQAYDCLRNLGLMS